jgi:hypothetical protein
MKSRSISGIYFQNQYQIKVDEKIALISNERLKFLGIFVRF